MPQHAGVGRPVCLSWRGIGNGERRSDGASGLGGRIGRRRTGRRPGRFLWLLPLATFLIASGCSASGGTPFKVIHEVKAKSEEQTDPAAETQRFEVALVSKIATIHYFQVAEDGAREAAADLGVELISTGPEVADGPHQEATIRALIDQGVHAIAVAANDPVALLPVLREAREKGILVMTWDSDTVPEARTLFVNQVDGETLGRRQMDLLASLLEERGEFAILTGSNTAANLNEWVHWIKVQQQEYYPNMKLVDIVANGEDMERVYMLAKELLIRHPDLDGIIGIGSISPPGAARAVKELGKTGQVKVVGVSTPNLMREYLKEGAAQIVTLWSPKKLGYLTVYMARELLLGNMPYDGQRVPKVGNIRVKDDMVIMGEPLDFTKDNVDEYDF